VWAMERNLAAYQALRDMTFVIDAQGGAVSTSLNFGWLLEAAVALGLDGDIRAHAAKLLQRARHHDRHGHAMGCRALAAHAAGRGDVPAAVRHLLNADRSAALRESTREKAINDVAWARLAAQTGGRHEARARLDRACTAFEAMHMQWHLHQALVLQDAV